LIDTNAAGYGWFIDKTPAAHEEFSIPAANGEWLAAASSPAFGKMDLLTVVTHELGHIIGFEHQEEGVMSPILPAGARQTELIPATIGATPGQDGDNSDKAWSGAPTPTAGSSASARLVMLFDEKRGDFFQPNLSSSVTENHNWQIESPQWDGSGADSGDNGNDWIINLHPKKLHG